MHNFIVSDGTEGGMIGWGLWTTNQRVIMRDFWLPKKQERVNREIKGETGWNQSYL